MFDDKVAVRSGYYFGLIKKEDIKNNNIVLEKSNEIVQIQDVKYPLYEGKTWNDVKKIDNLLDRLNEDFLIKNYLYTKVNENE